jgi:hypothetical protein
MIRRKPLLFFTVVFSFLALFSVTGTWAECPDSVDPDFKWFDCNKYRIEFVDVVVDKCSDDDSKKCTFITTSLSRRNGSKTLSHTAVLQRENIEIVDVTCTSQLGRTCTYVKKDTGRGDDSSGFGVYQTAVDTYVLTWDAPPEIGDTAKITVEARGTDLIAGSPLDQLHKVGSKFTDQVFGAIVALEEPCVPPPPVGAKAPTQCVVLLDGTEPQNTAGEIWATSYVADEYNIPIASSVYFHNTLDCSGDAIEPDSRTFDEFNVYSTGGPGQPNYSFTVRIASPACIRFWCAGYLVQIGCGT